MSQSDSQDEKNFASVDGENNEMATPSETQITDTAAGPLKTHKHQLKNTWTLWYLEIDRTKSWEEMLNMVANFDTVEDFWCLYNHLKPPSEIKLGSDYFLFKHGIKPMWEDAANKQGGRWIITLNKSAQQDLDKLWLKLIIWLIEEKCEHAGNICGAVVNIRGKCNKISIWTANYEEATLAIGHQLKDALQLEAQELQFQLHNNFN